MLAAPFLALLIGGFGYPMRDKGKITQPVVVRPSVAPQISKSMLGKPSTPAYPDRYSSEMGAGWASWSAGNLDEAAKHYSAAARMQPSAIGPRLGMLDVAISAGQDPEIVLASEEVLSIASDNYDALMLVVGSSIRLGDLPKAGRVCRRVLELHPGNTPALRAAVEIEEQRGNVAAAKILSQQLARATPSSETPGVGLASVN